jgi:hypothetical protein
MVISFDYDKNIWGPFDEKRKESKGATPHGNGIGMNHKFR